MDYGQVFEKLVSETQRYLEDNKLSAMVLGISGGLDSTVTAAICNEVERRNPNLKFYGVSLPCSSNKIDENLSSMLTMKAFCNPYQYWVQHIDESYNAMFKMCNYKVGTTTIGQGNIKARIRMMYLYNLANYINGLVIDTDNLTEHYLGFFTIHGDVGDFNPIGGLWKHEIYTLATYLYWTYRNKNDSSKMNALKKAINIKSTDGNGVNDNGDMGQIAPAFINDNSMDAYTKVDNIIKDYLESFAFGDEMQKQTIQNLRNAYGADTVDGIISRIERTEYKRKGLPIRINRSLVVNSES